MISRRPDHGRVAGNRPGGGDSVCRAGSDVAFNYQSGKKPPREVKEAVEAQGRRCLSAGPTSRKRTGRALVGRDGRGSLGRNRYSGQQSRDLDLSRDGGRGRRSLERDHGSQSGRCFLRHRRGRPAHERQGGGCIINVGSTAGIRGEALHSHYAATKGRLNALTKSWSSEFAPYGIRVNCVAPGLGGHRHVHRGFRRRGLRESVRQSIPLKRIPPPEDIAGPILFLASDLARHITGAIINVNGGSVLCG